jgi:lysophospholipase L1-like esterase
MRIPLRRKIAYTAIIGVAALLVCEGALRVRAWRRYGVTTSSFSDAMLIRDTASGLLVPKPGFQARGAAINLHINSLGFRGEEIARTKPARTIRIACLGASTTFCAEVSSDRATWPARLQARLQQLHPEIRFEVINAGVPAYTAEESLKNLRQRVLPLNPDLVVYYEANNEIARDTEALAVRQGWSPGGTSSLVAGLSKVSLVFDLAYKNLAIRTPHDGNAARTLNQIPRDLPNHFVGLLDAMASDLAARDVPFLLSTFVVKYRRSQDRPTQIANADVAFYYMPWMSIDGLQDAMDVYNQAIVDYAARQHLPIVDDREAIPADADHFHDCMHLTDAGADAMADRVFRYLQQSRLIDSVVARLRHF